MNLAPVPEGPPALVPLTRLPEAHASPVHLYLARLRESGRRGQASALDRMAALVSGGRCSARSCPWHLIRYPHALALRAVLSARYQPATTNRHLSALRGVVRECWRLGQIPMEIRAQVEDVPGVKSSTVLAGRSLEDYEVARLRRHATPKDLAVLALLYLGGLRRSEAAAVTCDDVTTESDGVWVLVREGKGGRERRIPLSGWGARAVREQAARKGWGPLLALSDRGIYEALYRLTRRAGLANVTPHDLRRTMVSRALDNGADLAAVARMVGHSSPRTTMRYDRRGDRSLRQIADDLE